MSLDLLGLSGVTIHIMKLMANQPIVYRFIERQVSNNPQLTIEGHSFDYILSHPYFKLRWGDKVFHTNGGVYMKVGESQAKIGQIIQV